MRHLIQLCLLVTFLLPALVQAQFTFTTNNGAITITGYTGISGVVIIPDTTNGYPVKNIGNYAFESFKTGTNLTSVIIPDSVTNIGRGAFVGCGRLTNVVLSTNITTISDDLFANSGLTSIVIPNGVISIENGAFDLCYHLGNVTIPNSVKYIGSYVFEYNDVTSATIPNSVTNLGDEVFRHCVNMTNLTIGSGITSIPANAFVYCTSLPTVSIPDSVTNIGSTYYRSAFSDCFALTNITYGSGVGTNVGALRYSGSTNLFSLTVSSSNPVLSSVDGVLFDKTKSTLIQCPVAKSGSYTIPDTVTIIWKQAFLGCDQITDVAISSPILNSGGYIFTDCTGLTNIILLAGMTNILNGLFYPCVSLKSFKVSPDNPSFCSVNGVLFDNTKTTLVQYPYNGPINYTVPNGVTRLEDFAFFECRELKSIILPNSITNLGIDTFVNCYALIDINIPAGIRSIGDFVFYNCTSLVTVSIPATVTSIGSYSFGYCQNLNSLYFRGNAPNADPDAFTYMPIDPLDSWVNPVNIYYLPGTSGWSNSLASAPTTLWLPQMQIDVSCFGGQSNQFGFNINWASGQVVVVEASGNLSSPVWQPVQTNMLTTGSAYFSDPQWTNYPSRFYRLRSP